MEASEITTPPTLRIVPWFQLFAFSREESGTLSRLTVSGELRPGSRQPKHVELVIRRGETATAFRPSSVSAERHGGNRAERRRGESGIGLKLQFSVPAALLEDRQSHFRLLARKSGALDLPWPMLESVTEESGMRFSVGALAAAAGLGAATLLAAPAAALADSGTPAPLTSSDDSSQPQSSDTGDTSQCPDPSADSADPSSTPDASDPSQCPDPGSSTDPSGTPPGGTSTDPSGTPPGGTSTDPSGTPPGGTSTDPSGTPPGGTSTDPSGTPPGGTSTDPSGTPPGGTSTDPSGDAPGGTSTDPSGTPPGGTSADPTDDTGTTTTDATTPPPVTDTTATTDTTTPPPPATPPAPVADTATTDTTTTVPVTTTAVPATPAPVKKKTVKSTVKKKPTSNKGGAPVNNSTTPTKDGKSGGGNSGGGNAGGGNNGGGNSGSPASIIKNAVTDGIDLSLSGKVTASSHTGNERNASGGAALDKPKVKSSTPAKQPTATNVQVSSFTPVDPSTVGTWGGGSIWTNPFTSAQLQRFASLVGGTTKPPNYLVKMYKQAARQYHLPWEILAAINFVETDYGSDLAVSTSGAEGWMEFMPGTWAEYGEAVSRNGRILGDKPGNPWDPRDAIFSAAKLLVQDGAHQDLARAVFGYNHAGWYVQKVLTTALQLTSDNLEANVARRAHDEKAAPKHPLTAVEDKEFAEAPVQSAKQDGQDIVYDELKSMTSTAKLLNGIQYTWGGGHSNWVLSTGYDCSGFVSEVLHTAGYLTTPQTTQTLPGQSGISSGAGKWVTIYDRTDEAIDSDHVIIDINGQFWESGGGGPAGAPRVHRIYNVSPSYLKTFNLRLHPEGL